MWPKPPQFPFLDQGQEFVIFPKGCLDLRSFEQHIVAADNSILRIPYRFISKSLTTASGNRLFGSVVEHLDYLPGCPGSIPTKVMGFFQPNLLCFVLCYDFHVVRILSCRNELKIKLACPFPGSVPNALFSEPKFGSVSVAFVILLL